MQDCHFFDPVFVLFRGYLTVKDDISLNRLIKVILMNCLNVSVRSWLFRLTNQKPNLILLSKMVVLDGLIFQTYWLLAAYIVAFLFFLFAWSFNIWFTFFCLATKESNKEKVKTSWKFPVFYGLAHPRDTSRAIAQASLCFCIASKGHRNEPSLENNGNFHKVILKFSRPSFPNIFKWICS